MKDFIIKALALVAVAMILFMPGCSRPGRLGVRFGGPEDTGAQIIQNAQLPGQDEDQDLAVALTYNIPLDFSTSGKNR